MNEENIKALSKIRNDFKECKRNCKEFTTNVTSISREEYQAIENLIRENKEQQKDLETYKKTIDDTIKILEEKDRLKAEIEKQQAEIEEYKRTVANDNKEYEQMKKSLKGIISKLNAELNTELEKKDKIINLLAYSLADYVMYYEYDKCRNPEMIKAKAEEQKQYFEKKVNSSE